MAKEYLKHTLTKIDQIVAEGDKSGCSSVLKKFIQKFYLHTPLEFLSSVDTSDLYHAAFQCWKFVSEKSDAQARKVRVYNPDKKIDEWATERTIIELCVPDSPFILDSVTAEIVRNGYRIYEVMHPVLKVKRDKNHKIIEIFDDATESSSLESVMHFQISNIANDKHCKALEQNISDVLTFVNASVCDWRSMMDRAEQIVTSFDNKDIPFEQDHIEEVRDFLKWVIDNNFIFLGYREYRFDKNKVDEVNAVKICEEGIFKVRTGDDVPIGLTALLLKGLQTHDDPSLIEITKSSRKSLVHRSAHMDYIGIKIFNDKGEITGEHRILGLFTSSVYYQSAKLIPIIRKKIDTVVKRSGFQGNSHNCKELITVLENYPRDELLQISENDLFNISMGIVELAERPTTKLFVRKDRFSRFISCIVFLPRERFNTNLRKKVQTILESAFSGVTTDYYSQVTESPLARVHVLIRISTDDISGVDVKEVEEQLVAITTSWTNGLRETLIKSLGEKGGEQLYFNYVDAFPESFKDMYHFGGTLRDIVKMEEAYRKGNLTLDLDLYHLEKDNVSSYQLKLYHPETQVTLSDIMPIIENMGFYAIDELTFFAKPLHKQQGIWIHHFRLIVSGGINSEDSNNDVLPAKDIKKEFEEALFKVWRHDIANDPLNKLILRADMKWRDIILLRAYGRFILQTAFPYGYDFTINSLASHPVIVKYIVQLFHVRFSPKMKEVERNKQTKTIISIINKELSNVKNVAEDRVIRQFLDTVLATVRTNYFKVETWKNQRPCLSFKFDSTKIPNLPLPRPHKEIFVYSYDVEGIHLRGGKVARGGLRWSDRPEDFRTEVLGLVKAQMVKNSVIVPVGSKGGFVVKNKVDGNRDAVLKQGIECYETYLSGLLDVTDNIVDGKIISPENVVCHDGEDPYLVVAADKGTAAFSDIANSMAQKYEFWLDDAFASGGSVGYDHKKMGITARGAWISVQRHFLEMNIDCQNEPFTVVGIGDMSGDVFGNGMLLSKHIRLVGAFNHLHIFIDPTPDSKVSYKERKRLFNKGRSSWIDYDADLISEGGGVFDRTAKTISLTKEIKQLFDIRENNLSPDDLIKKMLKSKVDLLWNGGIGTYIKSESESHESVGDKANDSLRVNGKDLRCKVIGEGGNLGLTQKGRIEYALNGGRLNTDAIDNSAGVDCSDHEVNIKIALGKAVSSKKISLKERNKILEEMTDEVAKLVLRDNTLQTQAITVAEQEGTAILEQESRLMNFLEDKGLLDRKIEFLPDQEDMALRHALGRGLTRPEISVILAYSKLDVYEELLASNLPDDAYFDKDLVNYFPEKMRKPFADEIHNHELRREIVVTSVTNSIINRVGSTFFYSIKEDTGMKGCDIVRAYTITRDVFKLRELWDSIEKLGGKLSPEAQTKLYVDIRRLVERSTSWFLRNFTHPLNASEITEDFTSGIGELMECLEQIISAPMKKMRNNRLAGYLNIGLPKNLARKIANLEVLASACDIVNVSRKSGFPIRVVSELYYKLGMDLSLAWLRVAARKRSSNSYWERLAIQSITETLFDQQMRLTTNIIKMHCTEDLCVDAIKMWREKNSKSVARYDAFIEDLRHHETITHSMLTVAIQRVEALG